MRILILSGGRCLGGEQADSPRVLQPEPIVLSHSTTDGPLFVAMCAELKVRGLRSGGFQSAPGERADRESDRFAFGWAGIQVSSWFCLVVVLVRMREAAWSGRCWPERSRQAQDALDVEWRAVLVY
jgi:hypothetical protein